MPVLSVAAVCVIIAAVILTITLVVFYINREDVSPFILYFIDKFRTRHISTQRESTTGIRIDSLKTMEKIDTHHHMIPPIYLDSLKGGEPKVPAGLAFPNWSPQISLDFMARNSISTAILSFANTPLYDSALCREINAYAYNLRLQHPAKFGFFATLPSMDETSLPDVLSSIKFCYENFNPEGFTLLTSYDGRYLGHELFRPVFEVLNRLHAVVFIHPIANSKAAPVPPHPSLVPPIIDFTHETTRTACSLIYSSTLSSYPNIKFILSHASGTLPYISTRITDPTHDADLTEKTPEQFMKEAKTFYADLAAASYSGPVEYVENFFGRGRTTYGSDFPFIQEKTTVRELGFLNGWMHKSGKEGREVMRGTALGLFPRLREEIERSSKKEKKELRGTNTSGSEISGETQV